MAIVTGKGAINSFQVRKRFSKPNGYGLAVFGISIYGHANDYAGIYQRRKGKIGKINVKEKFYWPDNPQTELQQANRGKMTSAVAAWKLLSDNEKNSYRARTINKMYSGYNLFVKEYLLSH